MADNPTEKAAGRRSLLSFAGSPYLLLILTMLFWAGNWIYGRSMREEMTPIAIAFWRWLVALMILYPFAFPHLRAQQALLFGSWKLVLLLGALGVGLFHTLVYTALSATSVANASLVNSVMPIAIVCISWLLNRERITLRQGAGILVSSLGVVVIIARGDPELLVQFRINRGDLWALASIPVWGLYSVLLKRLPREMHSMTLLGAIMIVGVALLAPFFFWQVATTRPTLPTADLLIGVLYMSVFASVLAYLFWNRAVGVIGANRAGQFVHLLPIFASGLAFAILGEPLHLYHFAGIALIVPGIYLATMGKAAA